MNNILVLTNLCMGSIRTYSPMCVFSPHTAISSILEILGNIQQCFIINDLHTPDDPEFAYLPPHMIVNTEDIYYLPWVDRQIAKLTNLTYLKKRELNGIACKHNRKIILESNFDTVYIGGFTASLDVMETAKSLYQETKNIAVIKDTIGDLTPEMQDYALNSLAQIGIPVIGKDQIK